MVNALGDLSLISKRDGGVNDRDALCDQGGSRSVSPPSSCTGHGQGDTSCCGRDFAREIKQKCKKPVLIILTAAVIIGGE